MSPLPPLKESGNKCLGSGKLSFVHLSIGSDQIASQPESNLRGLRRGKEDLKISWAEHGARNNEIEKKFHSFTHSFLKYLLCFRLSSRHRRYDKVNKAVNIFFFDI